MGQTNFLLVTADQWPGTLLGCAGRGDIDTPTLDRIAANGVRFANAHSECPICIPARRSLMTGTAPRVHGDRVFQPALPAPALPHLARVFRDAGWQTGAVGKLHVYPPRDRIGFEEVASYEEGRPQLGGPDDWEIWLAEQGHAGLGHAHAMSNNGYEVRPWHLPEDTHPTVWQARQMCRMIQRRDPTRPQFWHLSFNFPHPPIVPPQSYLSMYAGRRMQPAVRGDWAGELPAALERVRRSWPPLPAERLEEVRRAFHAQCTLIDHQLRLVLGTLREHELLDDTVVLFTSDHGDMLGDHGLFAKRVMLAGSVGVPMLLMGRKGCDRVPVGAVDGRLACMADIMPTLLDLAGLPVPETCTGESLAAAPGRKTLYCEALEGQGAMRMVTDGRWKLIWYPAGNRVQLFDRQADPDETRDLARVPEHSGQRARLTGALVAELYGADRDMVRDGNLLGCAAAPVTGMPGRELNGQRGLHWPEPPKGDPNRVVGAP
ncbi:sulfatase-like hydrolase/transferase [Rhodobacteraceae bacterium 2CG4]|uniref:Sulfatase-like hydrolase/transferase n=1 Tax=Halovulum marinum TaxID=2662447 RepID=A0A6L5YWX9_9RHOB|nr:sulfatase-like hydrolase/transferase [Halovulum marinum]MSU88707.1 sulfatase-like hydrolase/transferase [Halovulum marinum]